jgi:hypothetical protein
MGANWLWLNDAVLRHAPSFVMGSGRAFAPFGYGSEHSVGTPSIAMKGAAEA